MASDNGLFDVSDVKRAERMLHLLNNLEDATTGTKRRMLVMAVALIGDEDMDLVLDAVVRTLRRHEQRNGT